MPDKPARIAVLKREIAERQAELLRLAREYAADVAGLRGGEREFFMGLQDSTSSGTVNTVNPEIDVRGSHAKSRARITKKNRKHPFVAAFVAKGQTAAEAAAAIGYPRSTMQSWYRSDEHARPIPRSAVDMIKRLYDVPASAWPRITE